MSSISGLDGLRPTLKIIKYSKKIAIANKEAIICGWNLINKDLFCFDQRCFEALVKMHLNAYFFTVEIILDFLLHVSRYLHLVLIKSFWRMHIRYGEDKLFDDNKTLLQTVSWRYTFLIHTQRGTKYMWWILYFWGTIKT